MNEIKGYFKAYAHDEPISIKILYHDGVKPIEVFTNGDWIDLRASRDVSMKRGEFKLIPLGVSMKLPIGYEAHVVPRSSTFKKWGIIQANSMGVIDNSYCGNADMWMFPAIALRDTKIEKNDRICQFRVFPVMGKVSLTVVDNLLDKNRGGFGTSGKQ